MDTLFQDMIGVGNYGGLVSKMDSGQLLQIAKNYSIHSYDLKITHSKAESIVYLVAVAVGSKRCCISLSRYMLNKHIL